MDWIAFSALAVGFGCVLALWGMALWNMFRAIQQTTKSDWLKALETTVDLGLRLVIMLVAVGGIALLSILGYMGYLHFHQMSDMEWQGILLFCILIALVSRR